VSSYLCQLFFNCGLIVVVSALTLPTTRLCAGCHGTFAERDIVCGEVIMPYTGAMWLLDEFYAKNQVLSSLLLKESYNFAIDNDTCAMDGM
jgi:hypothetical protein